MTTPNRRALDEIGAARAAGARAPVVTAGPDGRVPRRADHAGLE